MAALQFFKGAYSAYDALTEKSKDNLYFTIPDETPDVEAKPLSDKYCLFHGEVLIASSKFDSDIIAIYESIQQLNDRIDSISNELATYEIKQVKLDDSETNVKEAYALFKITPSQEEGGEATETQVGKTIKIYKDSALQNVELVNQQLVFTYLLADGTTDEVSVDVSNFLAESEFANGLTVSEDGVVSVKAAAAAVAKQTPIKDAQKNFVTVDESGVAVKSIDTDATILQKEIKVAGLSGTLGTGNYKNGDTIAVGTDIYTILQNILCQEQYPTVSYRNAAITSKIGAPTITLNKTGLQIYGTQAQLTVTCDTLSAETTPNEVRGLTYGYSATDDDEADSTATAITQAVSSAITENKYDLSATFTGFSGQTEITTSGTTAATCKIDKQALGIITMGTNKVSASVTGPVVSGSASSITGGYIVSNLGNTQADKTFSGKSAYSVTLERPTSGSSKTITGVLPCFVNITKDAQSNNVLGEVFATMALTSGNKFEKIITPSENVFKFHFMFDFPADREVTSFKVLSVDGSMVENNASYSQTEIVQKSINGFTMKYKRLQTTGAFGGDTEYDIILSKNLNEANISEILVQE